MLKVKIPLLLLLFLAILSGFVFAQTPLEKTEKLLDQVIEKSFPELKKEKPKVKLFKSEDTFFKSQFSIINFLTFTKIKTTILVNPKVFEKNAPEDGIKAILAHELAHTLYYKNKNRLELLGLISLLNQSFTVKFERKADLVAIEKGYSEGLIKYREWLYQNIPAKAVFRKKRDYFTPEEIELLKSKIEKNPNLINNLRRNVPKNLDEIKNQ